MDYLYVFSLLELSDLFFFKVLLILIEKKFEQKMYFCPFTMSSIVIEEGQFNFLVWTEIEITEITFSTLCKKFKIFPFILFEKRQLAQGIRWPQAADSPLHALKHEFHTNELTWNIWA